MIQIKSKDEYGHEQQQVCNVCVAGLTLVCQCQSLDLEFGLMGL